MIWGVLSDTHKDRMNATPYIIAEFKKHKVEAVIHCGDINPGHLSPELFGNLPVFCALIEEQAKNPDFLGPPNGWKFTKPDSIEKGGRVLYVDDTRIYLGHKRAFEFLTGSEVELRKTLHTIRRDYDGIRYVFAGHTHHQIYSQGHLTNFVNPGAVEDSFDGYEYAVINTDTDEITFSRIPKTKPEKESFSVGVISDSLNISELDANFWKTLAEEFKKRQIKHIIHCGNLSLRDIGRKELKDFQVYYNLRPDQKNPKKTPDNWQIIHQEKPVVEINACYFYVQLDLGAILLEQSECDMQILSLDLRRKYPEIRFILCGFTNNAFYEEGAEVRIINPGDIFQDRNFSLITLPTTEITFSHLPVSPLPPFVA